MLSPPPGDLTFRGRTPVAPAVSTPMKSQPTGGGGWWGRRRGCWVPGYDPGLYLKTWHKIRHNGASQNTFARTKNKVFLLLSYFSFHWPNMGSKCGRERLSCENTTTAYKSIQECASTVRPVGSSDSVCQQDRPPGDHWLGASRSSRDLPVDTDRCDIFRCRRRHPDAELHFPANSWRLYRQTNNDIRLTLSSAAQHLQFDYHHHRHLQQTRTTYRDIQSTGSNLETVSSP